MARLFTAVLLPDDVEAHLAEAIDAVRDARPDLRWVRPRNWHLTLRFLGECGPREVDRQRQHWAGRAGATAPCEMA
ncbi:MAG: RNA 2',3'-cyclic phosphodiesterase, partial [Acidimicrobiia bacterium]|nr:RNA 2',3'-cyclic phosphodiesterase [Acidimicrobiia bacterium]